MTLDDWLARTATKEDAFAASIGASQAAVNRYRHGRRMPRPAVMARIVAATGGAVTANDFHGLPEAPPKPSAAVAPLL